MIYLSIYLISFFFLRILNSTLRFPSDPRNVAKLATAVITLREVPALFESMIWTRSLQAFCLLFKHLLLQQIHKLRGDWFFFGGGCFFGCLFFDIPHNMDGDFCWESDLQAVGPGLLGTLGGATKALTQFRRSCCWQLFGLAVWSHGSLCNLVCPMGGQNVTMVFTVFFPLCFFFWTMVWICFNHVHLERHAVWRNPCQQWKYRIHMNTWVIEYNGDYGYFLSKWSKTSIRCSFFNPRAQCILHPSMLKIFKLWQLTS